MNAISKFQLPIANLLATAALALVISHSSFVIAPAAPATITISKSDTVSVNVTGISGGDGAAAAKILQNDLALSGLFNITSSGAGFIISGVSGGATLDGKVADAAGRVVLAKTYGGSARARVHQFADDIVETITGKRGIASTKIAFVATKSGRKEIYTADADGAGVQQLTRDGNISVAPDISTDGRRLLYTGYKSGYADVYLIDLASGARNRIIKYPGTNSGATFSPDGGKIAVTLSKDGNPELYVTGGGGGFPRRLTRTRGVESSPAWSPDGGEIIYSSDDRGGPQLYRIGAGGGGERQLATGFGYCTEPNWSPDGSKVAFSVRSGGGFDIAILNLGGGGTRTVGSGESPAWGADSRHLIYASGGSIVMLDTQTGKKSTLISGVGKATEPTWSR
jgi:TolB protein